MWEVLWGVQEGYSIPGTYKLFQVTRKDVYPMPRVDDTLDTLAGVKWFSTLDLISGYWHVEVNPKDRLFCTPEGLPS